jgi:hypothetical protein
MCCGFKLWLFKCLFLLHGTRIGYTAVFGMLPRVKRVHKFVLNNVCFWPSTFRLYHAVDYFICGWWRGCKQVVSCRGLTCLISHLTGLKVSRHAVDYCFWPVHACLFHIYNHAFTLFILIVIYLQKSVMSMCMQCYLNKDRSFVMLTSCIRLYPGFMF